MPSIRRVRRPGAQLQSSASRHTFTHMHIHARRLPSAALRGTYQYGVTCGSSSAQFGALNESVTRAHLPMSTVFASDIRRSASALRMKPARSAALVADANFETYSPL